MDVIVKGRHTGVPQGFRDHVTHKLAKIQRLDARVIRVDVEVSQERNPRQSDRRERVELTCRTRGPVIRAEACAEDRHVALDAALARLKERLRKAADRRKVHRGSHTPTSVAAATAPTVSGEPTASSDGARGGTARRQSAEGEGSGQGNPRSSAVSDHAGASHGGATVASGVGSVAAGPGAAEAEGGRAEPAVAIPAQGGEPLVVREKAHRASPMTLGRALFEMELVGHDFYLFRDRDSGLPSVVYRRRGFDYGVIRLQDA